MTDRREIRWNKSATDYLKFLRERFPQIDLDLDRINVTLRMVVDHPSDPAPRRVEKEEIPEIADIPGEIFATDDCPGWTIYYHSLADGIFVVHLVSKIVGPA
jgi:hypothetical protein